MKIASMIVVALVAFALGAVACMVSGFLGFIGGIALVSNSDDETKDQPVGGSPGLVSYQRMGPRPAA